MYDLGSQLDFQNPSADLWCALHSFNITELVQGQAHCWGLGHHSGLRRQADLLSLFSTMAALFCCHSLEMKFSEAFPHSPGAEDAFSA